MTSVNLPCDRIGLLVPRQGSTQPYPARFIGALADGSSPKWLSRASVRIMRQAWPFVNRLPKATVNLNPKDLITYTTAAKMRGVSRQAISRLVQRGSLSMVEIDGQRFVYRREVENYKPSIGGRPKQPAKKSRF